jgi:hypothetical protein
LPTTHLIVAAALAPLVLQWAGCVKVSTGRYAINGRDVSALAGPNGSGRSVEIGGTSTAGVRRELGEPLVRYEEESTDIFQALPRYRRVFHPWPVARVDQARPGEPRMLARVDYDERGVVRRFDTATTTGPVVRGAVPAEVNRAWPDLRERRAVGFGMK